MFPDLSKRSLEKERLDKGEYTPEEYARWEKEMWYIHRFFGEIRAMRKTIVADVKRSENEPISILDVGAGNGGLLFALKSKLPNHNLSTVGVEMNRLAVTSIQHAGIEAVRADAMQLPFADASFSYVMCSLFLHHLAEDAAVSLLREMKRVASRRIYVIDLNRSVISYYLYRFFGRVILQKFTLDDGALSIRRAYREAELLTLAESAGLKSATVTRSAINRLVLSADGAKQ
jgi:ubiquinone/menaquinone biosynthesis C-methylase UbiE